MAHHRGGWASGSCAGGHISASRAGSDCGPCAIGRQQEWRHESGG